jgi:nitroreductase
MSRELIRTIFSRRSVRKYADQPVAEVDIQTLLEAAMAAPSASNSKPWHFIVVQERGTLDELADAHPYGKMLFHAPLCISVCGDASISASYWVQDCSAATENLLVAATALGLGAVWLGVYPNEDRVAFVRRILGIPQGCFPLNLVSIGHPDERREPRTQYDRTRVHRGRW